MFAFFARLLTAKAAVRPRRFMSEPLEQRLLLTRLAVIGDYSSTTQTQPTADVAALVASWNPDGVVTAGDNNYPDGAANTIDQNIGQWYHQFIYPYKGSYGAGSADGQNHFWPSLGNHDWDTGSVTPYTNYFTLPNNERYYTVTVGNIALFVIDSEPQEPDGWSATSVQANWIKSQMLASTATWKLVITHDPPYSSGYFLGDPMMQWPFKSWGATAVIAGHAHDYERLSENGLTYFVDGLGGESNDYFQTPQPGSQVRFNADYGAMRIDSTSSTITFQFITRTGQLIDSYTINNGFTDAPSVYIPTGATWKYLDNGSNQGTAWQASSFNDSSWKSGPAELGYGDGDEATTVSYGPSSSNKYITTYFRTSFNVANPTAVTALTLSLLENEGSVVYLNGTEVYRNDMPSGAITYTTKASANIDPGNDTYWLAGSLNLAPLVTGTNVLAVELHLYAANASDLSWDAQLSATLGQPTAPSAPTNVQASVASSSQVALSWGASAGATSYKIYRGSTPGGESATPIATNVTTTSYNDNSVSSGSTYYYQVSAVNAVGEGARSTEVSAAVQTPPVPSSLAAVGGIGQIALMWAAVAGATSYRLYRGTSPAGEGGTAYATNITTTTFTDAGLTPGSTFYYKVSAVNGVGESAKSAEASATVVVPPAHVVVVVEAHYSSSIIGTANAPYLTSLANSGALFTNAQGVTYPGQPNYLALFSGSTQGVTDDTVPASQFAGPDLGSELIAAGLTFTGYAEGLPSAGSLVNSSGEYIRYHNPWSEFSDVPAASNQPFSAFPTNFATLPTVSFVVPNLTDDMHDGTVLQGDQWAQANLAAYATWAKTNNSLLIVTWDDNTSGASPNSIATIIYGQQVLPGTYADSINHYNVLRTIEDLYGLTRLGSAATASPIQDAWLAVPQGPAAPGSLQATSGGTQQISLTWAASSGATSYNVYRGATAGGESTTPVATGVATTSFNDTGLTPGVTYYYEVTAVNASGEGAKSTEVSAATQKATPVFSGLGSATIVYGTATATLSGTIAAGTLIPTGNVSITINGQTTPATISAGTGAFSTNFDTHLIPASATAYTISFSFAANATFNSAGDSSQTLTVSKRALTVTATGVNRVYDATAVATVTLGDNRVNSDVLVVSYGSALFADKTVATGKTVTVSGISVSGAAAGNYTLASTTATTTANVTAASLTGSITASNRVYDTTIAAALLTRVLTGVLGTDAVTLTGGTATFATKVVANGKTVTATGLALAGADAGNYVLANPTETTTANIIAASVAGSLTAANKVYDATTVATLLTRTLTGVLGTDVVTLTGGTATFDTKNIGTGKTITATGLTLSGTDAGNYTLSNTTETTTANVTVASLSGTITASNKVYDATTAATLAMRMLTGVLGTDMVTLTGGTATFDTKNIGTGKTVTVTGLILSGTDAGNYTLSNTTETTTANVTVASVSGTITASNKTYDATTVATLATRTLTGVLGTDVVTLTGGTATFDTKNVGTGKTITATGLTLSGTDAGNYTLSNTTETTTAAITALALTGSVTAAGKVYDGGVTAAILTRALPGVLGSDVVTLTGGAATFDTKNVGTGKTVTVTGLSLAGADAGNYTLSNPTETTTADVTVASVSGTITASDKIYDSTTAATLSTRTLSGALGTDVVTLTGGAATFDTKNAGTGKTVTATGLTLSGTDAGNYTLSNTTETTTAAVTGLALTGGITAADKPYDATTAAALLTRSLPGVLGTDAVSLVGGTATFDTANVGAAKTVTAAGLSLTGADAGNYALADPIETTTASITPEEVINGTSGIDDFRLIADTNPNFVDWFVFVDGNPTQFGQLAASDPAGLTINGLGSNDTILLNYASGNPLPNNLHVNGTFTINGMQGVNPLAGTNLEIGQSTVYVSYAPGQSPATLIQQALANGYNNGTWAGTPTVSTGVITSTAAAAGPANTFGIGYADSADGVVVGQPANTIEICYTVMGDANLDRVVNLADAAQLQANWNATGSPAWDRGNYNYDATVGVNDALLMTRNWNGTATGSAAAADLAAVTPTNAPLKLTATADAGDVTPANQSTTTASASTTTVNESSPTATSSTTTAPTIDAPETVSVPSAATPLQTTLTPATPGVPASPSLSAPAMSTATVAVVITAKLPPSTPAAPVVGTAASTEIVNAAASVSPAIERTNGKKHSSRPGPMPKIVSAPQVHRTGRRGKKGR